MSEYEYNTNTSSSGANIDCSKGSAQEGDNIQSFCYKVIARLLQLQGWFNGLKTSNVTENSTQALTSGGAFTALATKQNANTAVTHTASTAVGSAGQPVYITANGVATAGNSIPVASSSLPADPASAAAVGTSTNYARADHVHKAQTNISGNAETATTASKLGTNAGSNRRPIYFANGVPVQCSVALEVAITGSSASCTGNSATATTASKLGTNAGSGTKPVYFANGVPVACGSTLGTSADKVNITGNAATATTASSCTGNAATATKATQDANGNNIASTYSTFKVAASGDGYIKFNNGFIVQWGHFSSDSWTVSLKTNFRSSNPDYAVAIVRSMGRGHEHQVQLGTKYYNRFTYGNTHDDTTLVFDWIACGF